VFVTALTSDEVTALALVTNELATNAIKHAYKDGKPGHIRVTLGRVANGDIQSSSTMMACHFPKYGSPVRAGLAWAWRDV
jgi:two-component sensor histidine kinase